MTNNILDKLGIYDLVVLLLSGICMTSFSIIFSPILFNIQLTDYIKPEDTLLFFGISYFVGLFFQEIGAFIYRRILNRRRSLLLRSFCSYKESEYVLTEKERTDILKSIDKMLLKNPKALENYVSKNKANKSLSKKSLNNTFKKNNSVEPSESNLIQDIDLLYNYCKFHITNNNNSSRIDGNQSTAGLSRSLALYFSLLFISTIIYSLLTHSIDNVLLLPVFAILILVLFYRSIRFTLMRYTYIFRTYYYNCYLKDNTIKD